MIWKMHGLWNSQQEGWGDEFELVEYCYDAAMIYTIVAALVD